MALKIAKLFTMEIILCAALARPIVTPENVAESQAAIATKRNDNQKGNECYFKLERQNPDGLERIERLAQSKVSTGCAGGLKSFEELAADSGRRVSLCGAQNFADLALIRGAAEFNNDFDEQIIKERMKNMHICFKHRQELVFNWEDSTNPKHFFLKNTAKGKKPACNIPHGLHPDLNMHKSDTELTVAQPRIYLQKDNALAFLKRFGTHLHVGSPLCQAHAEYIRDLEENTNKEEAGMQITPNVDSTGSASLEGPSFVDSESSSIRAAYCGSQASGSSGHNVRCQPSEPHRTTDAVAVSTITGGMKSTLKAFLKEIRVGRLTSNVDWGLMQEETKRKKADGCRKMRRTVYKIVAPGYEDKLEEMDCKPNDGVWSTRNSVKLQSIMEAIAEKYSESADWPARRALLAIVAPILSFTEVEKFIPGLTHYRYTMARNYARGMSKPIPESGAGERNRYSEKKVEEFVNFITSEAVMIGLPYGSVSAKTSSGEKVQITSTLRQLRNDHIAQLYERYLENVYGPGSSAVNQRGIGRSTMLRILNTCSAHRKKAIVGLNEFIANGRDAFDHIYQMLKDMLEQGYEKDQDFVKTAIKRLKESHQYLEGDFRLHVKGVSRVADHCIRHALSDPDDAKFATPCEAEGMADSHLHDMLCDRCEQLKNILKDIRLRVEGYRLPKDEKERLQAKYEANENAIKEMRRHQLRSVLSSMTRKDTIERIGNEDEADVFITLDWAMKWLPTKARETQKDFFGKRGISWHITHILRRDHRNQYTQRTLVHVTDQETQDSDAVLAILQNVLEDLRYFNVERVILRSDNAGCYHSSKTLATIKKISEETNVHIVRYTFSEAQAGKSSCDRMAAVVKQKLRDYIDQGNDVTQSSDFIKAMETAISINGMKFFDVQVERPKTAKKTAKKATKKTAQKTTKKIASKAKKASIQQVTFFNDIRFNVDGIQVQKYSGIGSGKEIEEQHWKGIESEARLIIKEEYPEYRPRESSLPWSSLTCVQHIGSGGEESCEEEETENQQQTDNEGDFTIADMTGDEESLQYEAKQEYYDCPEPGCVAQFSKLGNLQRHIIIGDHNYIIERKTMRDFALDNFRVNIAGSAENHIRLQEPVEQIVNDLKLIKDQEYVVEPQGWAMKNKRNSRRFSKKQKKYLDDAFNRGVRKKSDKVDPKDLAKQMEGAKVPRTTKYLFTANELLSATQIASYFGIKYRKLREQRPECRNEPASNEATCDTVDDQQSISKESEENEEAEEEKREEEEREEADEDEDEEEDVEDRLFYSTEDEMMESLAAAGIFEDTTEEENEPSSLQPTIPSAPSHTAAHSSATQAPHKRRHKANKHGKLI